MASTLISASDAEARFGIRAFHEAMENGDLRFRLVGPDGNAYIRTVSTIGGWQRSHSHRRTFETYIVEAGWLAFATLIGGEVLKLEIYESGAVFTTPLDVGHNVYLPAGATIHTVKHGSQDSDSDWWACAALDLLTSDLAEEDIRAR